MLRKKNTYSHKFEGKDIEFEVVDGLLIEQNSSVNKAQIALRINNINGIKGFHRDYTYFKENTRIYKVNERKIDNILRKLNSFNFIKQANKIYKSGSDIFIGTGRLIIIPKEQMTIPQVEAISGGTVADPDPLFNVFLVDYKNDTLADEKYKKLDGQNWIFKIEKNFISIGEVKPNLIDRSYTAPINPTAIPEQEAHRVTKTFDAHIVYEGKPNIKIAILDTGIDNRHPNLKNSFIAEKSWDFIYNRPDQFPDKKDYHGTCCAGLAAAKKHSSNAIDGVGKGCSILSYRIGRNDFGDHYGTYLQVNLYMTIKAFLKAGLVENADVISCSWSMRKEFSTLQCIIQKLYNEGRNGKGAVIVFSAGNQGKLIQFPANMNEVITVSGTNQQNLPKVKTKRDDWGSNFGYQVDIAAPGERLVTTDILYYDGLTGAHQENWDYVKEFRGTSGAAPQVAGCAGLMLSINPDLDKDQIKEIIKTKKTPFPVAPQENYGTGILNVLDAVKSAENYPST